MTTHHVYRHFSPDGTLLYVGMTKNPDKRPFVRSGRAWMDDTVRVEVSPAMTEDEAAAAERAAIRDEAPLFNRYRNNGNITALEREADAWHLAHPDGEDPEMTARIHSILSPILRSALRLDQGAENPQVRTPRQQAARRRRSS